MSDNQVTNVRPIHSEHGQAAKRKRALSPKRAIRNAVQRVFPSVWLRWHMLRRPQSAEVELSFLDSIVHGGVSIDVGANLGLYAQKLSRLSRRVHAFEPSRQMADMLRKTCAANVIIHEMALSDREGEAELIVPASDDGLVYSLASIEPDVSGHADATQSFKVPTRRLDAVVQEDVDFVKIDVEGHELNVLHGARDIVARNRPVFLVEAEDRHRAGAASSVFEFFRDEQYEGFFLNGDDILDVGEFDAATFQNEETLLPNGGRQEGCAYVNNFFFFPKERDGRYVLMAASA